jgi:hypothetical protein
VFLLVDALSRRRSSLPAFCFVSVTPTSFTMTTRDIVTPKGGKRCAPLPLASAVVGCVAFAVLLPAVLGHQPAFAVAQAGAGPTIPRPAGPAPPQGGTTTQTGGATTNQGAFPGHQTASTTGIFPIHPIFCPATSRCKPPKRKCPCCKPCDKKRDHDEGSHSGSRGFDDW